MLKPYKELREVDVTPYCKDRDGISYLPYNACISLLHEHGAESVYFLPVPNPRNGSSLYETETVFADKNGVTNRCYETRIEIHIDDKTYYMQSPVMNGIWPVRDDSMSQQRVWNSMTRSFVKAVAMYTGLGFSLWMTEEEGERRAQETGNVYHDIMKIQERVFETVTTIQKKTGMSMAQLAGRLGRTEEELRQYMSSYKILAAVENNLDRILAEVR